MRRKLGRSRGEDAAPSLTDTLVIRKRRAPATVILNRVTIDPYMTNFAALLREGRIKLDTLAVTMRASAPAFSAAVRRRKLMNLEARYADVSRRFELLRVAGTNGVADLKVALEKAFDAFRSEIGWEPLPRRVARTVQ